MNQQELLIMTTFRNMFATSAVVLGFASLMAAQAGAAIVVIQTNEQDTTSQTPAVFTPSSTDLINQGQPTFDAPQQVSGYTPFSITGPSNTDALNDGSAGAASDTSTIAFDLDGTWTSTFNLNTTLNPLGYDISKIQSISGWTDQRTNQNYQVSYSVVGDSGFVSLGTFSFNGPSDGNPNATRMTLDITGLTGVDAVRFAFSPLGAGGDEAVYRELDVFGSAVAAPTVPEPASLGLLAAGSLLAMRRRRA
jgi:hypothetical protein